MYDIETNPKKGLSFYGGKADRRGFKLVIPDRFIFSFAWHTKFKKFTWFYFKYPKTFREFKKALNDKK